MVANLETSQVIAYVETEQEVMRVSQVITYVETETKMLYVSHMFAYVESNVPFGDPLGPKIQVI